MIDAAAGISKGLKKIVLEWSQMDSYATVLHFVQNR